MTNGLRDTGEMIGRAIGRGRERGEWELHGASYTYTYLTLNMSCFQVVTEEKRLADGEKRNMEFLGNGRTPGQVSENSEGKSTRDYWI